VTLINKTKTKRTLGIKSTLIILNANSHQLMDTNKNQTRRQHYNVSFFYFLHLVLT